MRAYIKVAALVGLLAVTTTSAASDQFPGNGGSPTGDASILAALGIVSADGSGATANTGISDIARISNIAWLDRKRFSVEVVGEAETEPRGLLGRKWSRRQVAEIEFLEMPADYCEAVETRTPCYLVAKASEHDELKAPLGAWHVTNEDVPDVYKGLPSVGRLVHIPPGILSTALQQ